MYFHGIIESETQSESVVAKNFEDLMGLTKIFVKKFIGNHMNRYVITSSCEVTRDACGGKVFSMVVSISPKKRR